MRSSCRKFSDITRLGRKRFYKNTSVYQQGTDFGVHLDYRSLRTPLRKLFIVPREQLAVGVAQEWAAQEDSIIPSRMHLTSLCNTVIDNVNDTELTVDSLQQYLLNDTLCYYANEPDELVRLQQLQWTPIIEWFNERFSANVRPSSELVGEMSKLDSSVILSMVNRWTYVGLHHMIELTGSLILTMALCMARLSVPQAAVLSRLETEFQINRWGAVEWHHDINQAHLHSALSASLLFTKLTTSC